MKSTIYNIYSYVGFRSKFCKRLNSSLTNIVVNNTSYKSLLPNIVEITRSPSIHHL
jgi:hypothetical protein